MKRIATILIISFFTLGAAAQENKKQDKSVIKSEIQDLDKLIKDQTKEIEKICLLYPLPSQRDSGESHTPTSA